MFRRSRKRDSFEQVVAFYGGPLLRFVARLTGDPSGAEDLVQDVFIRLAAKDAVGNLIVPAFWSDNYVSIPPRGEIQVTCDLSEEPQTLTFNGWNTAE